LSKERIRLNYLDSGRGFAALIVMVFHAILFIHAFEPEAFAQSSYLLNEYIDLGKIGVIVFFLISGFVIPYSIGGNDKTAIKRFAISRVFRLYPVYWLSALLAFFVFAVNSIEELLVNLTMIQQFIGYPNLIGLYWTLQVELIFYFMIASLALFNKHTNVQFLFKCSIGFLLLTIPLAYLRGAYEIKIPLAIPLALSIMYLGSYIRVYILDKDKKALTYSKWFLLAYVIAIPIIAKLGYDVDFGFHENWLKYVISYYTGAFLFALIIFGKPAFGIGNFLGRISYSVYLFHPIIIHLLGPNLWMPEFNHWIRFVLIIAITIVFSQLTYSLIEKPFIKLGRELKQKVKS